MRRRRSWAVARPVVLGVGLLALAGCDGGGSESAESRLEVLVDANVGDGRRATDASIAARQIAVAPSGDVLLAEPGSGIRRVDARTGRIAAVPGTEVTLCADGPAGGVDCGGPASALAAAIDRAGRIYFAVDGHIFRTGPDGGRAEHLLGRVDGCPGGQVLDGPARAVCPGIVYDLALDAAGGLLIADGTAGTVVRLDPARGAVDLVAQGTSGADGECLDEDAKAARCLGYPTGIDVDRRGGVLIATASPYVYRVDPATGRVRSIAGRAERCGIDEPGGDGGAAGDACFRAVMDVAADADGTLYLADAGRQSIRRIDAATGIVSTVDATTAERTIIPTSLAVGDGHALHALVFGERFGGQEVRRYDAGVGPGATVAGNGAFGFCGDGGPARDACLGRPIDVAVAPDGAIYVADVAARRVRRIVDGTIATVAGNGGLAAAGETCRDGVPATGTCLDAPAALAVSRDAVYVLEGYGIRSGFTRVRRIDRSGTIETVLGGCRVEGDAATVPAADACLRVNAIAVDADDALWVTEAPRRVSRLDATTGRLVPMVTAPPECERADGMSRPQCFGTRSLAIDRAGNVYLGGDARVWKVVAGAATATIVAGNGAPGLCGDGGPALDACFTVRRVVADAAGDLFVGGGGAVRRIDARSGFVTTVAGRDDPSCESEDGMLTSGRGCAAVTAIDDAGRLLHPELVRSVVGRVVRLSP